MKTNKIMHYAKGRLFQLMIGAITLGVLFLSVVSIYLTFRGFDTLHQEVTSSLQAGQQKIEQTLDGLVSFAGSDTCLPLFRRLCRYYWGIDPVAAASHVLTYREMWDSEE